MNRLLVVFLFVFLAGSFGITHTAAAQTGEPRLLSKYGDWSAYMFIENGNRVCYMISQPTSSKGDYSKRGQVYALITIRPSEGTKDVFSYITGYGYKSGSDATITIDDKSYSLFTQDDTAWAPDAEADRALAQAIREGAKMTVTGVSSRGTETTDTFSLKGSGSAYKRINDEC